MKYTVIAITSMFSGGVGNAWADGGALPTSEQFQSLLTTCAAGSGLKINGEIRGSFTSVYEKAHTDAKNFTILTTADFLNSLRPEDKLAGFEIYSKCVLAILKGEDVSENALPDVVELPASIVTFGKPLDIKAKMLIANNAEIRSFPVGVRAAGGESGANGSNGGNGANGSSGAGGHGSSAGSGAAGGRGIDAGIINIEATNFVGQLKVVNIGLPGGPGGNGGAGGDGGAGGKGRNSVNGLLDCRSGPGTGGPGGNAGAGGDGGAGGAGGNGGTVALQFDAVASGSSIAIVTDGGSGGEGGSPGSPGRAGSGGPRGNTGGKCGSGGRGPGPDGVSANAGRTPPPAQRGVDGQIEVTIENRTSVSTGQFSKNF